ncbi:CTP synthase [Bifidobacterium olomucense]|uniref:CTP synthase n=1 Tax=Bifidobacterium olomucense TaxID=2675324 RepID=A0A7Y0HW77_9BIFI|nr:CTP synthase [Bifidobacterium sp. DSM 109959]NMM97368.1 CTP synthase [Bifidobacterium sp. DSM 109959]
MNTHHAIERLCNDAERHRRCFYPSTEAERQAIYTRLRNGILVRPHRNIYARRTYWDAIPPPEKHRHIIRALSQQYPQRVFADISAAAIFNLEYHWNLHQRQTIFIAASNGNSARVHGNVQRVFAKNPPICSVVRYQSSGRLRTVLLPSTTTGPATTAPSLPANAVIIDRVSVTSPARTLVDCGLHYPFTQTIAMFDSALRRGIVTREQILEICDTMQRDCGPVQRLLYYTNPLNENGGESFCYGTIIDEGFAVPELQHVFIAPQSEQGTLRVDFVWHTPDGRVIVLEFDGTDKYVNPSMTSKRSIRQVVHDERRREDFLKQAGVTTIIRVNYAEVEQRTPLTRKLLDANVPMARAHPFYERYTDVAGRVW